MALRLSEEIGALYGVEGGNIVRGVRRLKAASKLKSVIADLLSCGLAKTEGRLLKTHPDQAAVGEKERSMWYLDWTLKLSPAPRNAGVCDEREGARKLPEEG